MTTFMAQSLRPFHGFPVNNPDHSPRPVTCCWTLIKECGHPWARFLATSKGRARWTKVICPSAFYPIPKRRRSPFRSSFSPRRGRWKHLRLAYNTTEHAINGTVLCDAEMVHTRVPRSLRDTALSDGVVPRVQVGRCQVVECMHLHLFFWGIH